MIEHCRQSSAWPVERREVPDPVTGQTWRCRVQRRMPDPAAPPGQAVWLEHVVCRHEGMLVALDLPLGELGRLSNEQLLQRIVDAGHMQTGRRPDMDRT